MLEIVSAILGAIIGGIVTGVSAFWLAKRQETVQYQLPVVLDVLESTGEILSAYAPEVLKTHGAVFRQKDKLGSSLKQVYLQWGNSEVTKLQASIDRYAQALESFIDGTITREELETRRQHTIIEVRRLIERGVLRGAVRSRLADILPSRRGGPPPAMPA